MFFGQDRLAVNSMIFSCRSIFQKMSLLKFWEATHCVSPQFESVLATFVQPFPDHHSFPHLPVTGVRKLAES
jgi:hypothetical protein